MSYVGALKEFKVCGRACDCDIGDLCPCWKLCSFRCGNGVASCRRLFDFGVAYKKNNGSRQLLHIPSQPTTLPTMSANVKVLTISSEEHLRAYQRLGAQRVV